MQRCLSMLLLSLVLVTAACDDDPTAPEGEATARFVNASPTVGAVDVLIGEELVAENLEFQEASECIMVDPGNRTVSYEADGTAIGSVTIPFLNTAEYLGIAYDDVGGETFVDATFTDPPIPGAAVNALRFINLTQETGDIFITEAGVMPTGLPDVPGLEPQQLTGWGVVDIELTTAGMYDVGTTTDPFATVTIPTLSDRTGTVVFTGAAIAGGSTGFVVEPCI